MKSQKPQWVLSNEYFAREGKHATLLFCRIDFSWRTSFSSCRIGGTLDGFLSAWYLLTLWATKDVAVQIFKRPSHGLKAEVAKGWLNKPSVAHEIRGLLLSILIGAVQLLASQAGWVAELFRSCHTASHFFLQVEKLREPHFSHPYIIYVPRYIIHSHVTIYSPFWWTATLVQEKLSGWGRVSPLAAPSRWHHAPI